MVAHLAVCCVAVWQYRIPSGQNASAVDNVCLSKLCMLLSLLARPCLTLCLHHSFVSPHISALFHWPFLHWICFFLVSLALFYISSSVISISSIIKNMYSSLGIHFWSSLPVLWFKDPHHSTLSVYRFACIYILSNILMLMPTHPATSNLSAPPATARIMKPSNCNPLCVITWAADQLKWALPRQKRTSRG